MFRLRTNDAAEQEMDQSVGRESSLAERPVRTPPGTESQLGRNAARSLHRFIARDCHLLAKLPTLKIGAIDKAKSPRRCSPNPDRGRPNPNRQFYFALGICGMRMAEQWIAGSTRAPTLFLQSCSGSNGSRRQTMSRCRGNRRGTQSQ
jgi:hypothetical protein